MLNFKPREVDSRIVEKLKEKYQRVIKDPRIHQVIERAKSEVADSLFFHASELNQVVYNYSWQIYTDSNKGKKKLQQEEESKQPLP